MMQDRKQPEVRFLMCARGFLLEVGIRDAGIPTLYAFDDIKGVVAWFLDQYGEPEKANGGEPAYTIVSERVS